VLDEINRANMDAAFGQVFTALDASHPLVSLPFFDAPRRQLSVPGRFRIIGTMNTYDKNFLFRMSYALTRRFAMIPVDVPDNADQEGRDDEVEKLWEDLRTALKVKAERELSIVDLKAKYEKTLMEPLYGVLVTSIRANPVTTPHGLGRGIGFAQVAAALRHAVMSVELGVVSSSDTSAALDWATRGDIVPQLEGLPGTQLAAFAEWWAKEDGIQNMTTSISAVRDLTRGMQLFQTS
jgi:hypothetical protein